MLLNGWVMLRKGHTEEMQTKINKGFNTMILTVSKMELKTDKPLIDESGLYTNIIFTSNNRLGEIKIDRI